MAVLTLLPATKKRSNADVNYAHRAASSEGEAAARLLEENGYPVKRVRGEGHVHCPFHQDGGPLKRGEKPYFYINLDTSQAYCQYAGCNERANLRILERHFGIDDGEQTHVQTREEQLRRYEECLVGSLRDVFYRQGLTDTTIQRFRLGYNAEANCWVIPYLEGRRPRAFRFYDPVMLSGPNGSKYWWERGAEARLFNVNAAVGDNDGRVIVTAGECLPGDAEVLTPNGWVRFDELTTQRVAQWHEGRLEFVEPEALIVKPYSGKLIRYENHQRFRSITTPGHRIPGTWRDKTDFVTAEQGHGGNRSWPRVGELDGPGIELSDDQIALQVSCAADSTVYLNGDGSRYVMWNFTKQRKIDRLEALLSRLDIKYRRSDYAGRTNIAFSIPAGERTWLHKGLDWAWIRDASMRQRRFILDELGHWDGHDGRVRASRYRNHMEFTSADQSEAEWVQTLAHTAGCVATMSGRSNQYGNWWRTNVLLGKSTTSWQSLQKGGNRSEVDYEGLVYCVEVPSGAFLVRQEGCVTVTGNCKTMLLEQLGYPTVSPPGEGMWRDEWFAHFNQAHKVFIVFDNDDPRHPKNQYTNCQRCGQGGCRGHNPGQEAAVRLVERFGWRATNVLLPRAEGEPKTDINEFFVRDGNTAEDFAELAFGKRKRPYIVRTLDDLIDNPPDEVPFLIEGLLPASGRLMVAGPPKSRKSAFVENMALSLAAGIRLFGRFKPDRPTRVLLLDRELSRRALYDRLMDLIQSKPGYRAAGGNLCIDHEHRVKFDLDGSYDILAQLVETNGAEVIIFDTAYKFFAKGFEASQNLAMAFDTLDRLIETTGVSVVMTHHLRKRSKGNKHEAVIDADEMAGSFLWSGWPNGTVLLNFLHRTLTDPFTTLANFTAFRDCAPPEPLVLHADRSQFNYTAIAEYMPEAHGAPTAGEPVKPDTATVGGLLLEMCPIAEKDFLEQAARHFNVKESTVKPYLYDALTMDDFDMRGPQRIIRYLGEVEEETYEQEQLRLVKEAEA